MKTYFNKKHNRSLAAIKQSDLNRYVEWRKNVWISDDADKLKLATYKIGKKEISNPKPKSVATMATIKRENTALNGVFKYAVDMGYIRKGDRPELNIPAEKTRQRPYFTKEQFEKLIKIGGQRARDARGDDRLHFERRVLLNYIRIAAYSGLRRSELIDMS